MTELSAPTSEGYLDFWTFIQGCLEAAGVDLFVDRKPSSASWMTTGTGIAGVYFAIAASRREEWAKVEVLIQRSDAESRWLLDRLKEWRGPIEADFGSPLEWVDNRVNGVQRCRIAHTAQYEISDSKRWPEIADWFVMFIPRLQHALHDPITRFGGLIPPGLEAN